MNSFPKYFETSGSIAKQYKQKGEIFSSFRHNILSIFKSILIIIPPGLQKLIPNALLQSVMCFVGSFFIRKNKALFDLNHGKELKQKLNSLSEGLGMPAKVVFGLNAFEYLSSKAPVASLGCTSLVIPESLNPENKSFLAYNHDFPPALKKILTIRKNTPDSGYQSLSITYPALLGCISGINEKGMAVSLNHTFENHNIKLKGYPITTLVQDILDYCETPEDAKSLIKQMQVPNGSMITVTNGNKSFVAELSSQKICFRDFGTNAPFVYSFNRYQLNEMESVQMPLNAKGAAFLKGTGIHDHNFSREKHFFEWLGDKESFSETDITKLMANHNYQNQKGYGSICAHSHMAETVCHARIYPQEKKLKIWFGSLCDNTTEVAEHYL